MRHWSLTRMLCCPARLPFNPSSRLPGGTAISRNSVAACNCRSFRRAVRWMSVGNRRDTCPRKIFSVSAHAKLSIIAHTTLTHGVNNVKRPLDPLHQPARLALLPSIRCWMFNVRCSMFPTACSRFIGVYAALQPLAFSLGKACSQIRTTFHPARRNVRSTSRSRVLFPANLRRQKARLFFGLVACLGHPCQKQPSTNSASRTCLNTKSTFTRSSRGDEAPINF